MSPATLPASSLQVLTDIYQALFKLQENADLAKTEHLVGSLRGHPVFLPGKRGVVWAVQRPWVDGRPAGGYA